MTILSGHTSQDTAYQVDDYPYGFRLRCKIRYWLEYKKNRGFRLMSQTSNPKKEGLVWNKPKASTYSRYGGCMTLNDERVTWTALDEYSSLEVLIKWKAEYVHTMPEQAQKELSAFIKMKLIYEEQVQKGNVTCTTTIKEYGSILAPDFGSKDVPTKVETQTITGDYTKEQLDCFRKEI